MSSLWLRKLALAGATLAPTSLAFSHYTQKPTQSSTAYTKDHGDRTVAAAVRAAEAYAAKFV